MDDGICDDCGYEKAAKSWKLVTSEKDLSVGDEIILVVSHSNTLYAFNTATGGTKTVTMSGSDEFTEQEVANVNKITLLQGYTSSTWALKISGNLVTHKSKGNFNTTSDTEVAKTSSWTITISGGEAKIVSENDTTRFIGFNNTDTFKPYSTQNLSTYPQPSIYKLG